MAKEVVFSRERETLGDPIPLRLTDAQRSVVRKYAKRNGMTEVGVIRSALDQFFAPKARRAK